MKTPLILLLVALGPLSQAAAAPAPVVPAATFNQIGAEFSGELAQENVRRIIQHHRIQGSPMMAAVAAEVLSELRRYGLEARTEGFAADGQTRYQTFISPLGWELRRGELWVESAAGSPLAEPLRLCRAQDVPMCVSTYSKAGDWSGELVEVNAGTEPGDYQGKDVRGKVALAYGYAAQVVRQAVLQHGAVGVVIYPHPKDRPEHPDLVRYNGIWTRASELPRTSGGFQISANQYQALRALMRRGAVRVHGRIDATLKPFELTVVHAYLRGSESPREEVLLTAHLDHPKWSANDNASGSGALLEVARTLRTLIASQKLPPPRRTLHFMWVPEFFGTMAWATRHPEARRCGAWDDPRAQRPWAPGMECIVANLNLDMVGEDNDKTHSRFILTRTPDSVPSLLNPLLGELLEQARGAQRAGLFGGGDRHWPAEQIAYSAGSDHDVLLGLGVPAAMFGHDPDWTHHSSEDTLDKTDPRELRRVGTIASAAAFWLSRAPGSIWEPAAARDLRDRLAQRSAKAHAAAQLRGEPPPPVDELTEKPSAVGPRRRVLLPLAASAFESLSSEDQAWWKDQERLFQEAGGLDLVVYEAVNFMNGRRDAAALAQLLTRELQVNVPASWVEHLVMILSRAGLVWPAGRAQ